MGREVRKVPSNWKPPLNNNGCLQPHYDESFREAAAEWKSGYEKHDPEQHEGVEYWEYSCNPPEREYYRPEWDESERTHYMMYETTSEGTPISPAFATPEELAKWLADTGASSFGSMTATYEQWLAVCKGGYAPSAVVVNGQFMSGVEATLEAK